MLKSSVTWPVNCSVMPKPWSGHRREGERGRLTLSLRRQADAMVTCYQYELPYWYRLMIASRGETPVEAAKPLMGLSNIKDAEHARRRIAEIREQLRLS
jgi:hypothetical protein